MTVNLKTDNEELVASVNWYHTMTLADGTQTSGRFAVNDVIAQMDALGLPADMTGMRVLDVETNDGGFAFECERRGADVTAIDRVISDGFVCAAKINKSSLQVNNEIAPNDEKFDIIIASGWVYRLANPFFELRIMRGLLKVGGLIFIDSIFIDGSLVTDIDAGATAPLTAHADAGLWQAVDWIANDDAVTLIPSIAGLKVALRKAGFLPIGHAGGQGRGVVAAVAHSGNLHTRAHGALPDVRQTTRGGMTLWTRHSATNGHYALIDEHVVGEAQTDYFPDIIDYTTVNRALDIGGHIGAWTANVCTRNPNAEITVVEPDERSFIMLELNTDRFAGVDRIHGYVDYGDPRTLIVDRLNTGGNHMEAPARAVSTVAGDSKRFAAVTDIPQYTLEDLASRWQGAIDVLKLDCEGSEARILLTANADTLTRFRYIVGEYHTGQSGFQPCVDHISEWFDVTIRPNADVQHLGMFVAVRKFGVYDDEGREIERVQYVSATQNGDGEIDLTPVNTPNVLTGNGEWMSRDDFDTQNESEPVRKPRTPKASTGKPKSASSKTDAKPTGRAKTNTRKPKARDAK